MLNPDVFEKVISYCQNATNITHFELYYEHTQLTISKGIFGINRKKRPIVDISEKEVGRVRLGVFFFDLTYCSFTWKEKDFSYENCIEQIKTSSAKQKIALSGSYSFPIIEEGYFIETFDPRQSLMSEQMRQGILHFNLDVIHGISKSILFRELEFEDAVTHRQFWTKNKHVSEKGTHYTVRHTLQLPHSEITQIKSENTSRYFADLASIPLNAVLVRRIMEAKEVDFNIQDADYLVLEPRVVSQIVKELLPCFSSQDVGEKDDSDKGNFLQSKRGSSIANRYVHISDDPLMMCGLKSRTFDNAGVPAHSKILLQDGVVHDFYVPHTTALQKSIQSSGHLDWDDNIFYGNIMIKAGRRSLNMIFDENVKAVVGEHIIGKIDFNQKTGAIAFQICMMLRENNDKMHYVGIARFKGNILDILSNVVEATNQSERFDFIDASGWILNKNILSHLNM